MYAAVVRQFDQSPRYETFADPLPSDEHEVLVDVLASGLHPRVRSQADGSHYTATDALPLVPGIDGVGRRADGSLLYFVLPDTIYGALAERTVVDLRRSIPLPMGADPIALAAAMNPGMSSWVALHHRVAFQPGMTVLVLGATGSAGQLAVQIAKHLGAGTVIAVGRGAARLAGLADLGADHTVSLDGPAGAVAVALGTVAAEVDVVLDYLWGAPTERALIPIVMHRADSSKPLTWVSIGSIAGATITLPSAALRQANLQLVGSGQGSVSTTRIVATLPALVDAISAGAFHLDTVARPLAEVEAVWNVPTGPGQRIVLLPSGQ